MSSLREAARVCGPVSVLGLWVGAALPALECDCKHSQTQAWEAWGGEDCPARPGMLVVVVVGATGRALGDSCRGGRDRLGLGDSKTGSMGKSLGRTGREGPWDSH